VTGPLFVQDEILLAVKAGTSLEEFRLLLFQIGGTVVDGIAELGVYRVRLPPGTNVRALEQQLKQNPLIHSVEPNFVVRAPRRALLPDSVGAAHALRAIDAPSGDAIPLAILDSGLMAVEGLDPAVVSTYDALNPDRAVADPLGHGTQMALVAAGAVVPGGLDSDVDQGPVPIVAIRAFDDQGHASNFALMRSISHALEQGARVLNMSWGTRTKSGFLRDAVAYAQSKGMILVASAGNEPTGKPQYPAAYAGVVAVGATDESGRLWDQSNYGDFVFLAAAGSAMFPVGYQGPPGTYAGTSISSAYVARALAQYLTLHPGATTKQALQALHDALTDAGAEGKDPQYGYGVLDNEALERLLARE
jgi:hypothetical protein